MRDLHDNRLSRTNHYDSLDCDRDLVSHLNGHEHFTVHSLHYGIYFSPFDPEMNYHLRRFSSSRHNRNLQLYYVFSRSTFAKREHSLVTNDRTLSCMTQIMAQLAN